MRSVLIVFGIAIGILAVAMIFTPRKGLVDNPADEAYKRQKEYEAQEEAERKKKDAVKVATGETKLPAGLIQGAIAATMTVAGRGTIEIELYPKAAPKTVAHFTDLVKKGFYNGILFHRVVPDFVVQAGDPGSKSYTAADVKGKDDGQGGTDGLGAGGSGEHVPFESSGLKNEIGTLAMALSGPRTDTGDSQFFINLKHNEPLDGDYCVFGQVKGGMDVVNKIQRGDKIESVKLK